MTISRHVSKEGGEISVAPFIRKAVVNGIISFKEETSQEGKRLDHYAQEQYGDASL